MSSEDPILIIGAGIIGLTLAQALRKASIPFKIFERDSEILARGSGWGMTIHWALPAFIELLPQDIVDRLPETYVNPEAVNNGEKGQFMFYDLRSGEERWKVPPNDRIRVSRQRLRNLLMTGVDVQWGKRLEDTTTTATSTTAKFDDGSSIQGSLLIGCDGSRSRVRQILNPSDFDNYKLPVRLLGVSVPYPVEKAQKIRELDPYFLQGGDPKTDAFFWFSFLDTPTNNDRGTETYTCQILTSWPYRAGFLDRPEPTEIPEKNEDRVKLMKTITAGWAEPFKSIVQNIPLDAEAKAINLEDWVPRAGRCINPEKNVLLIGDAAHAMTMCMKNLSPEKYACGKCADDTLVRGEAGNHGITDVESLLQHTLPALKAAFAAGSSSHGFEDFKAATTAFEHEMCERTARGVLASRRACLDAHSYQSINEKSPLIARRVVNIESD
ncbi:MAG: hypothetical protein M1819_004893 [Sarea resinae]|nr:MAG: hypothetical protein M1819_004893 [Sarea resinae]